MKTSVAVVNPKPVNEPTSSEPPSERRAVGRTFGQGFQADAALLRRIAHDIASPSGVASTAVDEIAGENLQRPELVGMARRGLRRLRRLSEQLAIAADLASGPVEPDRSSEDVHALVKRSLDDALAVDGRRDVTATLGPLCPSPSCADARPLRITVDRRLFGVVVREIIGNALRLTASTVRIRLEAKDELVVIRVEDDGPGFCEEALTILEGKAPPTCSTRGLGLSLAIAKQILAAHGATLAVEASSLPPNRRGRIGAAVLVEIPLAAAAT